MTVIRQRFSGYPGGAGIGAQSNIVDVVAHDGDASLEADIDTDADSFWTFTFAPTGSAGAGWVLNPGPVYWEAEYNDDVRVGSSKSGGIVGANSLLELPLLFKAWGDGVVEDAVAGNFAVSYDSAGLDVDIAAGLFNIDGVWVSNPSSRELTLAAADATHPRIDRVVLELTRTAGDTEGQVVLKVSAGTPAASPAAPTLTDSADTLQVSLAQVRVNATSTTVTSVTDERDFTLSSVANNPTLDSVARTEPGATALTTTGTSIAALEHSVTLVSGVRYDIYCEATLLVDGASAVAQIAPFIDGTGNLSEYLGAPAQSGIVALTNAHVRANVLGAGSAITCGVLAKRSSTASAVNYYAGVSRVSAVPRK